MIWMIDGGFVVASAGGCPALHISTLGEAVTIAQGENVMELSLDEVSELIEKL